MWENQQWQNALEDFRIAWFVGVDNVHGVQQEVDQVDVLVHQHEADKQLLMCQVQGMALMQEEEEAAATRWNTLPVLVHQRKHPWFSLPAK